VLTVTPTPMDTPTPTVTPMGSACGNGVLEAGEDCDICAVDCEILPCDTPGDPMQAFQVDFDIPLGQAPTVAAILVGYRSDRVSVPTSRTGSRITDRPADTSQLVSGQGYAVRVVLSAQSGSTIPAGHAFVVHFDSCSGADPVADADFGCTVQSCGSNAGPIDGCTCTVTGPLAFTP
jgi:hypothetical protein